MYSFLEFLGGVSWECVFVAFFLPFGRSESGLSIGEFLRRRGLVADELHHNDTRFICANVIMESHMMSFTRCMG